VREFAFQGTFKRRDDVHDKVINRCQQFFFALQQSAYDWLFLGTTKTGLVYRLKGWQIFAARDFPNHFLSSSRS
jgi:hypothetical protein